MGNRNLRAEVEQQANALLNYQKQELTDSIRYAAYIQKAMLPAPDLLRKFLPEHFVLYKPKDIVSGDFYWINRYKDSLIFAVADCTGHGVPGGFMSVMGISFLNEIVSRGCFSSASSILNQLRERVMKALHQTGDWDEQKDGMDIALCIIDNSRKEMQYSGANNNMFLSRGGSLLEFKGDKMPIGVSAGAEKSFSNKTLTLEDGDFVYLYTDGYIDQFGGLARKKFKLAPFRDLLLQCALQPPDRQLELLGKALDSWQGDLPQVDDILVAGFAPLTSLSKKIKHPSL